MKWQYDIKRTPSGRVVCEVVVFKKGGEVNQFPLSHVCRHSPDGFEMGYGGSGPADLALSILAHYFESFKMGSTNALAEAELLYQKFKADVIAQDRNYLLITAESIEDWFAHQLLERENHEATYKSNQKETSSD